MKFRLCWIVPIAVGFWPMTAAAVSCAELDGDESIRAFLQEAKGANPLAHDRLSVHLEMSPCAEQTCASGNRAQRMALIQNIHLIRTGNKRRAYVMKGPNSAQCFISRDHRDYICSQCDATSNIECRSIVRSSGSGRLIGTNIDVTDFDPLTSESYHSSCSAVKGKDQYLKIETVRKSGESVYERIVTIVDKGRGVPLTINYFAQGTLRKVYRFFPKYYVKVGERYIATIFRVRSTQGSEKNYQFETQVRVLKDPAGGLLLFLDPSGDPQLEGYDLNSLFFTN